MQAATALPFAAGAILLATVTLNAANPKRNKPPNSSGFASSTSGSRRSIDNNRAMQFASPEFGGSLSAARRSPIAHSGSFSGGRASRSSSGHSRTQSLNRNVPYTPSATVSMSETLHSRNTSSGSISGGRGRTSTRSSQRVHRRPGHYPTQSLPEFTFPAGNHTSASRRPTYNQPIGFLGSSQVGSENKDQRIPATLF